MTKNRNNAGAFALAMLTMFGSGAVHPASNGSIICSDFRTYSTRGEYLQVDTLQGDKFRRAHIHPQTQAQSCCLQRDKKAGGRVYYRRT